MVGSGWVGGISVAIGGGLGLEFCGPGECGGFGWWLIVGSGCGGVGVGGEMVCCCGVPKLCVGGGCS